jgi:MerR family transcriptional regulator/heat shock protein HspR
MSTVRSDRDLAVYAISVAGELTGVDPQMLRVYETRGLVTPARTSGGTRRYSARDLDRIDRITMYLATGLNLAGIERVFVLEAEAEDLRDRVRRLGGRPPRQAEPRSTPYS